MECKICFEKFDECERKPFTLIPCGHTFCIFCIENLKHMKNDCPLCRKQILSETLNYALIDFMNASVEKPDSFLKITHESPKTVQHSKQIKDSDLFNFPLDEIQDESSVKQSLPEQSMNDDVILSLIKLLVFEWKNIENKNSYKIEIYDRLLAMCDDLSKQSISKNTFKQQLRFSYSIYLPKDKIEKLNENCERLSEKYDVANNSTASGVHLAVPAKNTDIGLKIFSMLDAIEPVDPIEPLGLVHFNQDLIKKINNLVLSWYLNNKINAICYNKLVRTFYINSEKQINAHKFYKTIKQCFEEDSSSSINSKDKDELKNYLNI